MKIYTLHEKMLCHRVSKLIKPYKTLLLAFSGGLDSTVLLDILSILNSNKNNILCLNNKNTFVLRVVHIHHGLSKYADYWATHCANECHKRNIKLITININLNKILNNTESVARDARYQALARILKKDEVLITAHHQNDQAETILLALKRGSGPLGLSAMAADMPFYNCRLLRPLLECNRLELETYARNCKLNWIKDDSNKNLRFDRNFLRLRILPRLQRRWPQFTVTASRSVQFCAEQEQLLDELLLETLKIIIQPDGSLRLTELITMSDVKRNAILRRWLARNNLKMPSYKQLICLWEEVALSRRDAVARIQIDNKQIRRFRNHLYILSKSPVIFNNVKILPWLTQRESLILPADLGILYRYQINISNKKTNLTKTSLVFDKLNKKQLNNTNTDFLFNIMSNNKNVKANNNVNFIIANDINTIMSDISFKKNISVYNFSDISLKTQSKVTIVRAPSHEERVSIRFGSIHGLLYIIGRNRGRKLKKIWQELNIPPWQRSNIPLLFYNDQLIAALGVFITWEGSVQNSEKQWCIFWQTNVHNIN